MGMSILFLVVYALTLAGIAVYSARRVKSMDDFFLGGRKMGSWMSAFSYGTSYFSAVVFIGYAGQFGWDFGISSTWIGIGNALVGSLLAWLVMAKRTRRMTQQLGASTMPAFFEKRYLSKGLKVFSAILIFVFLVPYSASVYQGLGTLFESLLGIPYEICMIAMVAITAAYLIVGGYMATALTDFVQGIIMLVGIVAVVLCVVLNPAVGGLSEGIARLQAIEPGLATVFGAPEKFFNLVSVFFLTSLGTWGLPQMVHKFYAIRDEKAIARGTVISTLFALVVAGGSYFMGGFGQLFYVGTSGPSNLSEVIPHMLQTAIPDSTLGAALIGVVMVLVLSASMSTLTSLVLVSSSSISLDLLGGIVMKKIKPRTQQIVMRVFCALFIVLSFLMDLNKSQGIVKLMSLSWGCLAGAFIGPFVIGLYWKRVTRAGAWIGMAGGLLTCLVLNFFVVGLPGVSLTALSSGVVAMAASLLLTFAGSLLTPQLEKLHVEKLMNDVKHKSVEESR